MSKQHTPGPWFVSGPFIGPRLSPDSGIQIKVARVAGDETDAEVIANARLIAAAPDLLAELKFAVKLLSAFPAINGTAQVERMCAAITKAEG